MNRILLSIWLILSVAAAHAQPESTDIPRAFAVFDTASVQIGQPFNLSIVIEGSAGSEVVEWPDITTSDLQLLLEPVDTTIEETGQQTIERRHRAVMWRTGMFITPEWTVVVRSAGQEQVLRVESAVLTVESVLDTATDAEMRPWRTPNNLPYTSPWLIISTVAVVISGVATIIWLILKTGRKFSRTANNSPAQRAIAQLQDLLNDVNDPSTIYTFTAAITRQYIEQRLELRSLDRTTAEFIIQLRETGIKEALLEKLKILLDQADLVKFARVSPTHTDANRLVRFAIRWVGETEDEISQSDENGS